VQISFLVPEQYKWRWKHHLRQAATTTQPTLFDVDAQVQKWPPESDRLLRTSEGNVKVCSRIDNGARPLRGGDFILSLGGKVGVNYGYCGAPRERVGGTYFRF